MQVILRQVNLHLQTVFLLGKGFTAKKNTYSVFRALEILRGSQISLSCSSKRCRLPLISALLKASRREKWLYQSCAIRNRRKRLRERNVTSSTLSQKIFRNLKTCIDGAPGEMALSNFSNHEKNKEKWKIKEILLTWGGKQILINNACAI